MDAQKYHNETVFRTRKPTVDLMKLLTETIGPRKFYLHCEIGGLGWSIVNHAQSEKTVVIQDPQLAILVMLKLK